MDSVTVLRLVASALVMAGLLLVPPSSSQAVEQRVAVVLVREGGSARLHIAYPPETPKWRIERDFAEITKLGNWSLSQPQISREVSSTIATAQLMGDTAVRPLPIWPLVGALRRFDQIVIAYVGPARSGHGRLTNQFVDVQWNGSPQGITYVVRVLDRSFARLSQLMVPIPREAQQAARKGVIGKLLLLVALAIAAGVMTYCIVRVALSSSAISAAEGGEP